MNKKAVTYETGNPLFVNNISGSPSLGIGTTATVSFTCIKEKVVFLLVLKLDSQDFMILKAQSASFVNETTQFETRLFDIKTFTDMSKLQLRLPQYLAGDHIQGGRSGATGYVHKDLLVQM